MTRLNLLTTTAVWTIAFLFLLVMSAGAKEGQLYKRTIEEYVVPDVTLLDQEGNEVQFREYLDSGKPVIMDFIFATCTTICPVLSVSFAYFQKKLGGRAGEVMLVSISIDPDNDTPELMKEYIGKYGAKPGWDALTGKRSNITEVLTAFDAYVGNKMNHFPLTIMRGPGDRQWVRLYGLLSASDLRNEYQQLVEK